VTKLLEILQGSKFDVEEITAIYNPILTTNFIGSWRVITERITNQSAIFARTTYSRDNQRKWVEYKYHESVSKFEWNHDLKNPIIVAAHGTDLNVAFKIAATGFTSLSSIDAGYFGRGIYFTSSAMYCIPYIISTVKPSLIISYVVPGHIYPVVEDLIQKMIHYWEKH